MASIDFQHENYKYSCNPIFAHSCINHNRQNGRQNWEREMKCATGHVNLYGSIFSTFFFVDFKNTMISCAFLPSIRRFLFEKKKNCHKPQHNNMNNNLNIIFVFLHAICDIQSFDC